MLEILEGKIKSASLTRTGKRIADYILNHLEEALFSTSTELADAIGVSDSSVIRFTRSLGYNGYNEFKKDMHNIFNEVYKSKNNIFYSPIESLEKNVPALRDSMVLEQYFNTSIKNLETTLQKNTAKDFDETAKLLVKARRKYITGFISCNSIAGWMSYILSHMLPDVIENTDSDSSAFEKLLDSCNKDALVLFSIRRYNRVGLDVLKLAKSKGVKIILITDKITAPGVELADILFVTPVDNISFFNSLISPMFVCEAILNSISKIIGTTNQNRLKTIEEYISPHGFY